MDPAKETANANSKCLRIEHALNERHTPSVDRMEVIAGIVDEWRQETGRDRDALLIDALARIARLRRGVQALRHPMRNLPGNAAGAIRRIDEELDLVEVDVRHAHEVGS